MKILTETQKEEFLETLDALGKIIPVLDMNDRDFSACVLHRIAKIVREHGASHGVNLIPLARYFYEGGRRDNGYRVTTSLIDELHTPARSAAIDAMVREVMSRSIRKYKYPISETDIHRIIYNPPATIVYWKDGTKTIVKCSDQDIDAGRMDPETGIVYAIVKKVFGNKGNFNDVLRRLVKGAKKS